MIRAIQYTEPAASEADANARVAEWVNQCDFLGGRVLPPSRGDGWQAQGFYDATGFKPEELSTDCPIVLVPESLARELNFREIAFA